MAARGIVLKGLIYKRDFQEFLLHPVERMELDSLARRDSYFWSYNYTGPNRSMKGVVIDWQTGLGLRGIHDRAAADH